MTTVYHGTGDCSLASLLAGKAMVKRRHYLPRAAFSTTTDIDVARLFAARKTPATEFMQGRITGVVIEFELDGVQGKDFQSTRDPFCMQEEHEVAVFNVKALRPVAVWRHDGRGWRKDNGTGKTV